MSTELLPYAPVLLKLLQGVLTYDDKLWEPLMSYVVPVQRHFASMGLLVTIDEAEGYAYLTQPDSVGEESNGRSLPRLVRRTHLTYSATVLCVVLREALQQADAQNPDETRFVLPKGRIQEMMLPFFAERSDMTRLFGQIDRAISQVVNAGFLSKLNTPQEELYEVQRIIKAKISADKLVEIREKLRGYMGKEEE